MRSPILSESLGWGESHWLDYDFESKTNRNRVIYMEKKKSEAIILRNSDGEDKWDKPVVAATDEETVDAYYRRMPDKRLFDMPRVILIEEDEHYVVIKNIWKYDEMNLKKCRDMKGKYFDVEEIEFIKVGPYDYASKRMILEEELPSNIIIKELP